MAHDRASGAQHPEKNPTELVREVEEYIQTLFTVHGTPSQLVLSHHGAADVEIAIDSANQTFNLTHGLQKREKTAIKKWLVPLIRAAVMLQ